MFSLWFSIVMRGLGFKGFALLELQGLRVHFDFRVVWGSRVFRSAGGGPGQSHIRRWRRMSVQLQDKEVNTST